MAKNPELTLSNAKQIAKEKTARVSDFLSKEEQDELRSKTLHKSKKKPFDDIDAYCAEILARFGYDAYKAWKAGEIEQNLMSRMILAERARDKQKIVNLEALIVASAGSVSSNRKPASIKKSSKMAIDIYKKESKISRGEF